MAYWEISSMFNSLLICKTHYKHLIFNMEKNCQFWHEGFFKSQQNWVATQLPNKGELWTFEQPFNSLMQLMKCAATKFSIEHFVRNYPSQNKPKVRTLK
jgi:hypothetical protein